MGLTADVKGEIQVLVFPSEIKSAVTEEEANKLAELAQGRRVLELGTEFGRSTITMAQTAQWVVAIDHCSTSPYGPYPHTATEFLKNVARYNLQRKIIPIVGYGDDAGRILRSASFDMLFIDGDHTADSLSLDLRALAHTLCEKHVIAFHDYDESQFSDYSKEIDKRYKLSGVVGTVAWVEVP